MNRWTGTGHLTKDPKFLETDGGTAICALRIAVKRAGKQGNDGYFDVKCFEGQAHACADYLKAGREVAIDGRCCSRSSRRRTARTRPASTSSPSASSSSPSRNRSTGQANAESSPTEPAAVGGEAHGDSAA